MSKTNRFVSDSDDIQFEDAPKNKTDEKTPEPLSEKPPEENPDAT